MAPRGVDLFADQDTAELCPVSRLEMANYPHGFIPLAAAAPEEPWLYTGALENWPEVIARIHSVRPRLWGNGPQVLHRVRSPDTLFTALREQGIACPLWAATADAIPTQGRWVCKPCQSAGGRNISFWDRKSDNKGSSYYYQEYLEGAPWAAVYVGMNGQAHLLGITRQMVGEEWLHAAPFHYCGSIGPLPLEAEILARFVRLGNVLTDSFGLQGLFGVDGVLRDGIPYPVEVNPRYTASVEVLERASGTAFLGWHQRVFAEESLSLPPLPLGSAREVVGKAILFAKQAFIFPERKGFHEADCADIPWPGQAIGRGEPILTLFARGTTVEECGERLRQKADNIERALFGE